MRLAKHLFAIAVVLLVVLLRLEPSELPSDIEPSHNKSYVSYPRQSQQGLSLCNGAEHFV